MEILSKIIEQLLANDGTWVAIGTVLCSGLLLFIKTIKNRKRLKLAIDLAYETVEIIKHKTPTKIDDKAALALKAMSDILGKALGEKEVTVATAAFTLKHDNDTSMQLNAGQLADKLIADARMQLKEAPKCKTCHTIYEN